MQAGRAICTNGLIQPITARPNSQGFEIIAAAPASFTAAQLRVVLRAIVNLDPYTFADDLAEGIAAEDENEQRSAEELLLATIDATADENLTAFALRLALSGHVGIPRENEFDFLTEAEAAFAPPQPKEKAMPAKEKKSTLVRTSPAKKAKVAKNQLRPNPAGGHAAPSLSTMQSQLQSWTEHTIRQLLAALPAPGYDTGVLTYAGMYRVEAAPASRVLLMLPLPKIATPTAHTSTYAPPGESCYTLLTISPPLPFPASQSKATHPPP